MLRCRFSGEGVEEELDTMVQVRLSGSLVAAYLLFGGGLVVAGSALACANYLL